MQEVVEMVALPATQIVSVLVQNAIARGVSGREKLEACVRQALREAGCNSESIAIQPSIDSLLAAEPAAVAPIADGGDYATAEEIVREMRGKGWVVDSQKLCKVRNLPDNGCKGKGKRRFLRGPAIKWIETRCKRSASSMPRDETSQAPLGRILGFLKSSGPATPFIIGYNTKLKEKLALRWLKEVPEAFREDDDGKWSLIDQ